MARSRNIKPGFATNEDLVECSVWARLLFALLPMVADREGRLEDRPKRIKRELFPSDLIDLEPLLCELHEREFIARYVVDGVPIIQILAFKKHQNPHHREPPSRLPPHPSLRLNGDGKYIKPEALGGLHEPKAQGKPEAFASSDDDEALGQPEALPPSQPPQALGQPQASPRPAPGQPEAFAPTGELSSPQNRVDSGTMIPDKTPIPPERGKAALGLKAWMAMVKAKGEKAIPEGDEVFAYADEVGIPAEFLTLAWREFLHRYSQSDAKRYRNWRIVFRKAVRGNWLKLWWLDGQQYALTTAGIQAQRAHSQQAA